MERVAPLLSHDKNDRCRICHFGYALPLFIEVSIVAI
jgi:hypothetical protein